MAIFVLASFTSFSQVFDLLGDVSADYNIEDIAWKGDVLYAALGEGGVWYSVDEGSTWIQTTILPDAGFGNEAAFSLFVASNGDLIVGGNTAYNGSPFAGAVFRSSDDGVSWSAQPYEGLLGYEKSEKIVELSDGSLMMRGGQQKLFVSSLSSSEWTQVSSPGGVIFGFENINDLIFVVTNPSTGTAGTWVSSDLGTTWSRYGGNDTPVSAGTVTMAPIIKSGNYKYIGIGGTYEPRGLYRSGINDTLWVEVNSGLNSSGIYPICMTTDNGTIWMVFQATSGACRYTFTNDFGNSWVEPVEGLPTQGGSNPCVSKLMVFKSHLYTFANTSIYRQEDVASPSATGEKEYLNSKIDLYPNPVKYNMKVHFRNSTGTIRWEIINMYGQTVTGRLENYR